MSLSLDHVRVDVVGSLRGRFRLLPINQSIALPSVQHLRSPRASIPRV